MYDSVKQKILIGNTIDSFTLTFDTRIYYNNDSSNTDCSNKIFLPLFKMFSYYWFKETYTSTKTTSDIEFLYNDVGETWLSPDISGDGVIMLKHLLLLKFLEKVIYMEIDKCNSIDELTHTQKTTICIIMIMVNVFCIC